MSEIVFYILVLAGLIGLTIYKAAKSPLYIEWVQDLQEDQK